MVALSEKFARATKNGQKAEVDRCQAEYKKLKQSNMAPMFFEKAPEHLLIPMAAHLTQSLKDRNYTHFRITSYKCAVAQYCPNNHVYLDLRAKGGNWGVSADLHPEHRVVWQ